MPLFAVDEEKCDLCQTCLAACPAGLIHIEDGSSVPTPLNDADDACFDCGHCVAACPNEALSHKNASPDECIPIREDLRIGALQIGQLMRARRSMRNYQDREVDRQTISELLDIVRFAPSGCNSQPVHWLVVHDTDKVRRISGMVIDALRAMLDGASQSPLNDVLSRIVQGWDAGVDVVSRGAPHLIIAHAAKDDPMAPPACIVAQTYLELAAAASGLGACWVGLLDMTANTWEPLQKFLDLPDGHAVLATMAVGHPKFDYARIPVRKPTSVTWR
jgi:nitroreductase/NAD-dependent dihydropyrimidine dehydrogenase PreA subunit